MPMVSVFRRPRSVANLKYATTFGFVFEPKTGLPLPYDPVTGLRYSGNLMADQRDRTLAEQARDALSAHLELRAQPSPMLVEQLVRYESQVYAAQALDNRAGPLSAGGAGGGAQTLLASKPGVLKSAANVQWSEFAAWESPEADSAATPEQQAFRRSVARGAALFRDRTFLISDSSGLNSMNFGNPTRDSCNFCHNMTRTGMDVAPGQVDLGTTNEPFADPDPDLPLFRVLCSPEHPHPFLGTVIYTHDPGFALTTGRCADVGKITIQSMRALAARPPYFSNGSARNLREVIDFYERRYNIGFTEQEKQDLVNLLSVL
jgi:cytochrome c peroxidase